MEYTRKVPDDWVKVRRIDQCFHTSALADPSVVMRQQMSSTKAVLRFWSPRVKRLVQKLKEARERRDQASTDYAISVRMA